MERLPSHESYAHAGLVRHTETGEVLDIFDAVYDRDESVLPLGRYEHFKSTPESPRYYYVELVVHNVATDERLVIYRPLYATDQALPAARPLDMFLETVEYEGVVAQRFRYVGQDL